MERPLKIEVLINSPGPHDQVRVRDPFLALISMGVDCRIHERPFRFNSCVRPHSLVIWQRPLPISWQRQIEHLQWLRERGCLLLTEWDDHPSIFPAKVQEKLVQQSMAPLVACHAIHSSSATLAKVLSHYNPHVLVLENTTSSVPSLNLLKHERKKLRIFLGNQNRTAEYMSISNQLVEWLESDPDIELVLIGDSELNETLEGQTVEHHPLLPYFDYRKILSSCQMALLPLNYGKANRCKTVIKWVEAAAESVAVVAGPELYNNVEVGHKASKTCSIAKNLKDTIPLARKLRLDLAKRKAMVSNSHDWVQKQWQLSQQLPQRLDLYQKIWKRRSILDKKLIQNLGAKAPILLQAPFCI